jgi:hypothetical protein
MKTRFNSDAHGVPLHRLVRQLQDEARDQKRRVGWQLHALRGDEIRTPSRGPLQANGRPCIRWHFWKMAQAKQDYITQKITAVCSLMGLPNASGDARRPEAPLA